MADGSTTTYSFTLPEVGASEDSWGTKLNANWTSLDGLLDGTTAIAPNLTAGSWEIGGVAVTSTAAELNILDGVTATAAELNILDGVTATAAEINVLDGITATVTELNYVDGVTSAIQTQLDAKAALAGATFTGTVTAPRGYGSTETATLSADKTIDFSSYQNFVYTLGANITLVNPTTEAVGQSGFIVFIQDGTGGRTVSLGTDYETAGGAGLTLSTAASATDVVPYIVAASGRILLGTPQLAFS